MARSIFRSAITGSDGEVDSGYLALFWTMSVTVGVVPCLLVMAGAAIWKAPDKAADILQNVGVAIGAVCTGCGVVIGAVGAFRAGDKTHTTTTVRSSALEVEQSKPTAKGEA